MLDPVVPFTIPRLSGRFVARSSSCVSDATREDSRSNREIDYGFFFVDRCRSMGGRCGTGRKERKNCCCREGDLENCADCERRLTRRLKMFAKSRETGAEEVERYLLRCYS